MKENSHIHFAHEVLEQLTDENIKSLILEHMDAYILGSVFPDVSYYKKDGWKLAKMIHGVNSEDTSQIPTLLLNSAKDNQSLNTLVFTIGYITHRALDIVSHPVILCLTGLYYQDNKVLETLSRYTHRQMECTWDNAYVGRDRIQRELNIKQLQTIYIPEIPSVNLSTDMLIKYYSSFLQKNKLFRNQFIYYTLLLATKLGFYKTKEDLGLFYMSAKHINISMNTPIHYTDASTNDKHSTSLNTLILSASTDAINMILVSYAYYTNMVQEDILRETLTTKSLYTGISV